MIDEIVAAQCRSYILRLLAFEVNCLQEAAVVTEISQPQLNQLKSICICCLFSISFIACFLHFRYWREGAKNSKNSSFFFFLLLKFVVFFRTYFAQFTRVYNQMHFNVLISPV